MATGERRVDSPVSRGVVKIFIKRKKFWIFQIFVKTRFRQFPDDWLFLPGGSYHCEDIRFSFHQIPRHLAISTSTRPPCIGISRLNCTSDHFIIMTSKILDSFPILYPSPPPPCRRSCRALWQSETYKRGKIRPCSQLSFGIRRGHIVCSTAVESYQQAI